jgi:hypothetical protein
VAIGIAEIPSGPSPRIMALNAVIMWDTEDGPLPWRQLPLAAMTPAGEEVTASEIAVTCDGYVRSSIAFRAITEFNMPVFNEGPKRAQAHGVLTQVHSPIKNFY